MRRDVAHVFGVQVLLLSSFQMTYFGFSLAFLDEFFVSFRLLLFLFLQSVVCWCWQCTHQGVDCEHKVDTCSCGSSVWWVIVNKCSVSGWVGWLTGAWVCFQPCLSACSVQVWSPKAVAQRRWRSCGSVPMDQERWRADAGRGLRD
jgi:hypothetical protein